MKPGPVIVVPVATSPGTLADLRKAGYVPVLCDEPEKVTLVTVGSRVNGDDLLMSAMHALSLNGFGSGEGWRSAFTLELARRMKAQEANK